MIIRAPGSRQEAQALGRGTRVQAPPTSKEDRSVEVSGSAPYSHRTLWEASKPSLVSTLDPAPKGRKVHSGETCSDVGFSKADFSPPGKSSFLRDPSTALLGEVQRRGDAESGFIGFIVCMDRAGRGSAGRGLDTTVASTQKLVTSVSTRSVTVRICYKKH